jgi:HPt (histidine-containing phosphotransfer) domain-containing protein
VNAPRANLERRFRESYTRRLQEMFQMLEARDLNGLRARFHSLAGIGGTYGHFDVTELARRGEEHCHASDLTGALQIVAALRRLPDTWEVAA